MIDHGLVQLAIGPSAAPAVCPVDSTDVALCTEGQSLAPIMRDVRGTAESRPAAFMQFAADMHAIGKGAIQGDEPRVMGYAVRTRRAPRSPSVLVGYARSRKIACCAA